jgi:hypothetical protein
MDLQPVIPQPVAPAGAYPYPQQPVAAPAQPQPAPQQVAAPATAAYSYPQQVAQPQTPQPQVAQPYIPNSLEANDSDPLQVKADAATQDQRRTEVLMEGMKGPKKKAMAIFIVYIVASFVFVMASSIVFINNHAMIGLCFFGWMITLILATVIYSVWMGYKSDQLLAEHQAEWASSNEYLRKHRRKKSVLISAVVISAVFVIFMGWMAITGLINSQTMGA